MNEGTPEGTKLKELVGLEKEDAKYLMIDRVTAFLDYDIEHDLRLRTLFETAGCGSLFGYIKLFARPEDNVKIAHRLLIIFLVKQMIFMMNIPTKVHHGFRTKVHQI